MHHPSLDFINIRYKLSFLFATYFYCNPQKEGLSHYEINIALLNDTEEYGWSYRKGDN